MLDSSPASPPTQILPRGWGALSRRALGGDTEAAAALRILGCRLFVGDARAWSHVSKDGGIDWDAILDDPPWSTGERKLLELGSALWSGRGVADVVYLFAWLDDELCQVVVDAIVARRGARPLPAATAARSGT